MQSIKTSPTASILAVLLLYMAGVVNAAGDRPPSFADLVRNAAPGVVNIAVMKVIIAPAEEPMPFGPDHPFKDFFDRFLGGRMPHHFQLGALESGFIIDAEGMILTNNHVVEDAVEIKVKLADGRVQSNHLPTTGRRHLAAVGGSRRAHSVYNFEADLNCQHTT